MKLSPTEAPLCALGHDLGACALATLLLLLGGPSLAQGTTGGTSAAADPICGFTLGPHFYYEANQVRQGLSVDLIVGEAQTNQPVALRFFVHQKPRNFPLDRLQIEHGKFIHVIGMREDFEGFFHVHPERGSFGMWEVTHTFQQAGRYKIWSDLKYRGISYSFGHPLLGVGGSDRATREAVKLSDSQIVSGFEINFEHPKRLTAEGTNQFQFFIRNGSGKPVETESFLGSPMHLVIVNDDLSVYLHAHPESLGGRAPITFRQPFTKPGVYTLFAQFRPRHTELPAGEAILVRFQARVEANGSPPLSSPTSPQP